MLTIRVLRQTLEKIAADFSFLMLISVMFLYGVITSIALIVLFAGATALDAVFLLAPRRYRPAKFWREFRMMTSDRSPQDFAHPQPGVSSVVTTEDHNISPR